MALAQPPAKLHQEDSADGQLTSAGTTHPNHETAWRQLKGWLLQKKANTTPRRANEIPDSEDKLHIRPSGVSKVEILFKFLLSSKHAETSQTVDPLRAKCTALRSKQLSFSTNFTCVYVFNITQKQNMHAACLPDSIKTEILEDKTQKPTSQIAGKAKTLSLPPFELQAIYLFKRIYSACSFSYMPLPHSKWHVTTPDCNIQYLTM